MISRKVTISPQARADLHALYEWIANNAGPDIALAYVERVEFFLRSLELASERGRKRDDLRPGLRILGFERNLTIAITVEPRDVTVLRLFRRGRNWESEFSGEIELFDDLI